MVQAEETLWSCFQAFLFQTVVHQLAQEGVEHRADGDAEDHTHQAKGVAAHGDGGQHPDARQTHGFSHHTGIDQVALDLLEDQNEDHEPQGLDGADQQDKESADEDADESAENGDEGGEANKDGHHRGIGHVKEDHANKAQGAQDHRLGDLAGDEVGEGFVGQGDQAHEPGGLFLGQQGQDDLLGLAAQGFLLGQDIDGEDEGQHEVDRR